MSTDAASEGHDVEPRRPDLRFVRLGFLVLFVLGVVGAVSIPLTMPIGSPSDTEPGFWPFGVSLLTTALVGVVLFRPALLRDGAEAITRPEVRGIVLALPVLLLAVPALVLLGVPVTTGLVTFYWGRAVVGSSWRSAAVTAAALTTGILVVFLVLLDVPFPAGTLTGL